MVIDNPAKNINSDKSPNESSPYLTKRVCVLNFGDTISCNKIIHVNFISKENFWSQFIDNKIAVICNPNLVVRNGILKYYPNPLIRRFVSLKIKISSDKQVTFCNSILFFNHEPTKAKNPYCACSAYRESQDWKKNQASLRRLNGVISIMCVIILLYSQS